MKRALINTGEEVGKNGLVYLKELNPEGGKRKRRVAMFICVCGNEFKCRIESVSGGSTKSCGCHNSKVASEAIKKMNHKHGMAKTKIYSIWNAMISRCHNPKNNRYRRYGERGITVCDKWKEDCESFIRWAELNGYKSGLQIDRINNELGYFPENCRFVTPAENSRNRGARKDSKTGIQGITKDKKSGKYRARINTDGGKRINIGFYDDFFEACCARKSAEIRYW